MIAFFRNMLSSKLAIGLLALIALAFIITGVFTNEIPGSSSFTGGPSGDVIATVGKQSIGVNDMDDRVRRTFTQYAQQQPGLEMAEFIKGGGYEAVIDQSIAGAALEAFGRMIGLTASKKQVDGEIASLPAFQGADGKFNQQIFQAALAQQRITEQQLRKEVAGDVIRRGLYIPASGAVKLPEGLVKPYAALLIEERHGTVGLVPTSAVENGPAPTDAEINGFYKQNIAAYTTPERRVLRYAVIGRDQVAAQATPSEAEIRKVYDSNPDKYAARETRDILQVVLTSEAKAKAFKAAVTGGKSFADAAKAAGFSAADYTIGEKTQNQYAQLSSPEVAKAAFALPQGGVTDPIKSALGWYVAKAQDVKKIAGTPYEKARPQIAADLAKQKQDDALAKLINGLQDAIDNGQGFADLAKANGLKVEETPAITQGGLDPDNPDYKPSPDVAPLLASAFKSDPDQPPSVETIQQGERYALLSVPKVVGATPIPLAKVKDRVKQDFIAKRAADKAKAIAAAIEKKVQGGMSMADAFKAAPVKLPAPHEGSGRRIDFARAQTPIPPAIRALFTMPVGKTKLVPAGQGQGWFVIHLDKVTPGDSKLLPALTGMTQGELVQAAGNEYVQELSQAAADAVGVKRNGKAIADLRARLLGQAPAAQ